MDKLIYTAASGLKGHMAAQAAIANNMANASTIGFRAEKVNFNSLLLKGAGFDSRQPTSEDVPDFDRSAGAVTTTGRNLDVAIPGDQWMAVQANDGSEGYTRRGDLNISATGVLETGDGFPVMGSGGPITVPPATSVSIAQDGTISIIPVGGDAKNPQIIDRIKFASAQGSQTVKGLDNLIHVQGGGILPTDENAKCISGALEQSNVNMTQSLVDMIENQRSYEVQANLMKSAKDMDESAASVMRMPS
ncbi:MAG: flagellar basal-body rod protein FlgF [Sphingomonadales bacterium]|nr:flagellar basal-body rod protein FlgF [Sphingomonadales bacterium]